MGAGDARALVTADLENDTRFPDVARWLADRGIRSLCVVPATTALRKLGALAFGSRVAGAYSETDVIFLHQVARQVAGAVDNALHFEQAQSVQQELAREHHISRLLLDVNNAVISKLDLRELFAAITACLHRVMQFAYISSPSMTGKAISSGFTLWISRKAEDSCMRIS